MRAITNTAVAKVLNTVSNVAPKTLTKKDRVLVKDIQEELYYNRVMAEYSIKPYLKNAKVVKNGRKFQVIEYKFENLVVVEKYDKINDYSVFSVNINGKMYTSRWNDTMEFLNVLLSYVIEGKIEKNDSVSVRKVVIRKSMKKGVIAPMGRHTTLKIVNYDNTTKPTDKDNKDNPFKEVA